MEKYFFLNRFKTLRNYSAMSLPNSMDQNSGLKDLPVSSIDENYFSTSKDDSTAQENCNFEREGSTKEMLTNSRDINKGSYDVRAAEPSDIVVQKPSEDSAAVREHQLSDSDWNWIDIEDQNPVEDSAAVEEQELLDSDRSDTPPPTANLQIRSPLHTTDYERRHKHYYIGAGILNLGNTCYLNSVLQCFTHTVPLLSAIISFKHKTPCEDVYKDCFCVLCALHQHIKYSLVRAGEFVDRVEIADNLNYFSPYFKKFQEEDAHEFLQCFLDKLESCCDDLMRKDDGTSSGSRKNNIVKEVFGGRIVSSIQCCNCGHCSDTYESSIDYSLEIDMSVSIYDSLDSFTKIEKIDDTETKFTCDGCKQSVCVEKRIMLDQAPSVVVFHLKRFKNNGEFLEKINKFVDFPLKLDLRPYTKACNLDPADLKYDLYAIVVHIELPSYCGHYYCFIRSTDDIWFRIDDAKVTRVPEAHVLSQNAYLLFYAKQGNPCFSGFVEKNI